MPILPDLNSESWIQYIERQFKKVIGENMKKLIFLLIALFGASIVVHATTSSPQPSAPVTQTPTKNDPEKIGNGSGDDIDTVDEGDPARDKDPEADDTSTSPGKS